MNGETAVNELGQTYWLDSRRIRPSGLTLTDGAFEFRAQDEALGEILISGPNPARLPAHRRLRLNRTRPP
jgi:hypothetical protein